jgi:hypothetical protein
MIVIDTAALVLIIFLVLTFAFAAFVIWIMHGDRE